MPFNMGETLKKYRNDCGISVKEIVSILSQHGYKVSDSTIYNWENNHSQPTPGAFLVMCTAYKIENILTAFGYNGYNDDGSIRLNMVEEDLIEKYRDLDNHGKEMIDFVLQKETERMKDEYVEIAARGGIYKVERNAVVELGRRLDIIPYEEDPKLG